MWKRESIMAEKSNRGFAGMDAEKQRQIASKGGKAAHAKGTAHKFTPAEAREAGRKGGQAAHQKGTAHEFTPEEAREAGRKGGLRAHRNGDSNPAPAPTEPTPAATQTTPITLPPESPAEMPQGMEGEMEL
jgi:general stress protein YciG